MFKGRPKITRVANWGNYPSTEASVHEFGKKIELANLPQHESMVARGAGLSYGDASLAKIILSTAHFNKILAFDAHTGMLQAEAGTTLDEILKLIVPHGWFLPVTPGTRFITLGGAVAADVHGKNHHSEGAFCRYVTHLELLLADGRMETCSPHHQQDLFNVICGGLGHGAVILSVTFQLKRIETAYIRQRNVLANNLDEMLSNLQQFNSATYSVAWIDCLARGKKLGRGVVMLGEHAMRGDVKTSQPLSVHSQPKLTAPFFFPSFLLNRFTVQAFNFAYFTKFKVGAKQAVVHYEPYFYPLDFVRNWNKLYGRRGFLQYQFVIPFESAAQGLRVILDKISSSGLASFLAVLKALGPGEHLLSFPMPGFTLALDFPVNERIFILLDELDKIVVDLGGRIYLVKDARMKSEIYWKGYPHAHEFKARIHQVDPHRRFESALSKRLKMV